MTWTKANERGSRRGRRAPVIPKKMHGLPVWAFDHLGTYQGITHFVTTRHGGLSPSPWHALNLSFAVGDHKANVLKNRQILSEALGVPVTGLTTGAQVHGTGIAVVSEASGSQGACDGPDALDNTDGLVTDLPGICLMVLLADCVPILLYDPVRGVAGAVHAGWKGTLQGIAQKAVMVFRDRFGSMPGDIVAGIGPSIGPCCYEVGTEVIAQAAEALGTEHGYIQRKSDGRGYLDLWAANDVQLLRAGLAKDHIEIARICTYCHGDLFFSYRHDKGNTGRFAAGILINPT